MHRRGAIDDHPDMNHHPMPRMKKTLRPVHALALAAAALICASPLPALAQFYAGASIGQTQFEIECAGTTHCDRSGVAYKLFGGYMVNHNFAIEAVAYEQGKATFTATDPTLGDVAGSYRGRGLGAFALLIAPYSNKLGLFGKVGFINTRIKLDATASNAGPSSHTERHTHMAWGVGAGYDFTTAIGVRLELERARVKFLDTKNDVDMVTASLLYRF